ncbi:MAG: HAD-IB family phosphatase [Thermoplasmata archaeon]|nr:HAD-IB family phosphatase [Thermoplasmata archaeon]
MLRLVALDMDGTLVDVASSWGAVHDHFGDSNREGLRQFMNGEIDDAEFIRSDVRIWWKHRPSLTVDELETILADVPLMPGAAALIDGLKARRIQTAIVSGGLDLLAHRVARELRIDVALANGLRVEADGRLTGEGIVRVPVHRKEEVLARLQEQLQISPGESAAIGNSEIDVGLFRRCRIGVAFQPADEAVRSGATVIVEEKDLARVLPHLVDETPSGRTPART